MKTVKVKKSKSSIEKLNAASVRATIHNMANYAATMGVLVAEGIENSKLNYRLDHIEEEIRPELPRFEQVFDNWLKELTPAQSAAVKELLRLEGLIKLTILLNEFAGTAVEIVGPAPSTKSGFVELFELAEQ